MSISNLRLKRCLVFHGCCMFRELAYLIIYLTIMGSVCHIGVVFVIAYSCIGIWHNYVESTEILDNVLQKMSPIDRPSCKPGVVPSSARVFTTLRLQNLRRRFAKEDIEAYIIPSGDAHQSLFTSKYDARLQFISGFSGSAGRAVVFPDRAALWTDGRYHLQAENELDCNWILMKKGKVGVPTVEEYVIAIMKLLSRKQVGASSFITGNRKSWEDKIMDMHVAMEKKKVDVMIITALDEIAWLFNLRATDVPFNPFFFSYATVKRTNNETRLYIIDHIRKLTEIPTDNETTKTLSSQLNTGADGLCSHSTELCVQVKEYNNAQLFTDIDAYVTNISSDNKIWISPKCSQAIYSKIPEAKRYKALTPVAVQKSQKNKVETQGMINSNIRDAVALIKFAAKLEEEIKNGKKWTEMEAADELTRYRSKQMYYRSRSFEVISASGPNAAIIHYFPTNATNRVIAPDDMYLLDSGGQYLDGTTDVTRTFHFGIPTQYEKVRREIDAVARRHLWDVGLRYRHGTGHGIGAYLSVHEGPGAIAYRRNEYDLDSPLKENHFYSDEPGYYEAGKFGIRLENIMYVKNATDIEYYFPGAKFLEFETITLVPYEPKLIVYELLTDLQIGWLNKYLKKTWTTISPLVKNDNRAFKWLNERVKTITITNTGSFFVADISVLIVTFYAIYYLLDS
ncbi:hypothetical protein KUTeg_007430 [Tegillarca granosa]|uniref:Xaa-Pro aminopeptidase 1 n=1 Tax=Tegillarca granosa TaxID=220873 RepID=A0ABQ9FGA0_TEGGR|nr:hypothetical protein KUTeg_007430 [Tegillarca granosa]